MASLVATLLFLRYWRDSRERLFLAFGIAFALFAANWSLLALADPPNESTHLLYVVRALAFGVIIVAIIDKNRSQRGP